MYKKKKKKSENNYWIKPGTPETKWAFVHFSNSSKNIIF